MATVGFIPKVSGTDIVNYTVNVPAGITNGQSILLLQSDELTNNTAQNALHLVWTVNSITPDTSGNSFNILMFAEAKDDADNWYKLGYQFSAFRFTGIAPERQMFIDPNLLTFDAGIPESIDNGSKEVTRLSKQRGVLPPTSFRFSWYITDYDVGSANAFVSMNISVSGEKYDA